MLVECVLLSCLWSPGALSYKLLSLIRIIPDAGVPSHCTSVVLTTVVMPMVCASITVFRQQVSSVWLETAAGCVLSLVRIAPDAGVPSHCPSVVLTTVVMPMVCTYLPVF